MLVPELLPRALAFYRDPRSHPELRDATVPLPAGVTELLESYAGALGSEHVNGVAKQLSSSAEELHEALRFFVKEALFRASDDPMRTLGLQAPLTPELLKKHYRLLITLFHPDRDTSGEGWDTPYASRINDAHGLLRKQLREGTAPSDEWQLADGDLGQVSSGAAGEAVSSSGDGATNEAIEAHAAAAGRQGARPSLDLVHNRPSRLLIIWRLLKRRPRLSIYGALTGLVLAVALFVVAISEPTRPVIMATPQPFAHTGTDSYQGMPPGSGTLSRTNTATDSADDWRRAILSEPPAAGSLQGSASNQGVGADAGAQRQGEAQLATNPYRADADEIERRVEARIRARMESATRSILGRATRPKPAVAQPKPIVAQLKPTVTQAKPAAVPVKPTAVQAKPTVAQAKPALAEATSVSVEPNLTPASSADTSPAVAQVAPAATDQAPSQPKLETNDLATTNGAVTTSVTNSSALAPALTAALTAAPSPAPAPSPTTELPQLAGAEETASKPVAVVVAQAPVDKVAAASPELRLQALIVELENAYESEDVDAFAALFTVNADATEVVGRGDIYAHYADYFANTWIDRFKLIEMAWTPNPNGSYAIDSQVEIWMRLKDGSYEEKFVIPIAWLAVPTSDGGYQFDTMEY